MLLHYQRQRSIHNTDFSGNKIAAKVRVSPLDSPSVMNMPAPLVQRMFPIAYRANEFRLLQMKGLGLKDETGPTEESKRTKCVQG